MERATQAGLGVAALIFASVGMLGWFAPELLFAPVGGEFGEPAASAEIRAAYGGLFSASAALFAAGAWRQHLRDTALNMLALILAGFVFGRLWSLLVDGTPVAIAWATLIVEALGLGVALVLIALRRRRARAD